MNNILGRLLTIHEEANSYPVGCFFEHGTQVPPSSKIGVIPIETNFIVVSYYSLYKNVRLSAYYIIEPVLKINI